MPHPAVSRRRRSSKDRLPNASRSCARRSGPTAAPCSRSSAIPWAATGSSSPRCPSIASIRRRFQRDLSETHVARLARVLDALGRFLDPIIAVRTEDGTLLDAQRPPSPLGHEEPRGADRSSRSSFPEPETAYKILALNTEKAHNLREKALEVIRMARDLAGRGSAPEKQYALEFEEPALLTLGVCYERNGRFAGGAYHPIVETGRRVPPGSPARGAHVLGKSGPTSSSSSRRKVARAMAGLKDQGLREPLPAHVRRREDQPAALPQGRAAVFRRDPRQDDRAAEEVQTGVRAGGSGRARRRARGRRRLTPFAPWN